MTSFSYGDFHRVCQSHGLNPDRTSLHAAECISRGLDPQKTSTFALDCIRHDLDPNKTSPAELQAHKEEAYC